MTSIRRALVVPLLIGTLLCVGLAGLVSSLLVERQLRRELDRELLSKARALASLTEQEGSEVVVEFVEGLQPEFSTAEPREYFEVWTGDGTTIRRSRSLAGAHLPLPAAADSLPRFSDYRLPDGRPGRLVQFSFVPQVEADEMEEGDVPGAFRAMVSLARGKEALHRLIAVVYGVNLGSALLLALGAALVVNRTVPRGLAPLAAVARQVAELGSENLARRVTVEPPVEELVPIAHRLNDLLERLERAFARERRFSSDVAHELRTPIAELKSLAEVGARWPADPGVTAAFFADALAIARQMERIAGQLLALARAEAGLQPVHRERVELQAAVAAAWSHFACAAAEKQLTFIPRLPSGLAWNTDADQLGLILANLFANAVRYSPEGSGIELQADAGFLEISNPAPLLTPEDLPFLFDRFWRKDAARSESQHSGLGLALVRSLAELLGFGVSTRLSAEGRLTIRLFEP